jgi:hypothetical protein
VANEPPPATTWSAAVALRPGTNVICRDGRRFGRQPRDRDALVAANDTARPTMTISAPQPKALRGDSRHRQRDGHGDRRLQIGPGEWANDRGGSGSPRHDGVDSFQRGLYPGANLITVTATDLAGNTATTTRRRSSPTDASRRSASQPVSGANYAVIRPR